MSINKINVPPSFNYKGVWKPVNTGISGNHKMRKVSIWSKIGYCTWQNYNFVTSEIMRPETSFVYFLYSSGM